MLLLQFLQNLFFFESGKKTAIFIRFFSDRNLYIFKHCEIFLEQIFLNLLPHPDRTFHLFDFGEQLWSRRFGQFLGK